MRAWALAQISPGINLIKLTVLVGHGLRGWAGILAAVSGLLLPSGLVTVLMTAGYGAIREQPLVAAAMRGVLPATIGLSLAMSIQMARPIARLAHQEGPARLIAHLVILAGAALLMGSGTVSPVVLILGTGGVTLLALRAVPARPGGGREGADDQPA